MSWRETRQALVDALNTVDGVKATIARPTAMTTGDAWCRLGPRSREDGWFIATWLIYIKLPQNEVAADEWSDEKDDELREAIETTGIAYVTDFENVNLGASETGVQFGLQITLRST